VTSGMSLDMSGLVLTAHRMRGVLSNDYGRIKKLTEKFRGDSGVICDKLNANNKIKKSVIFAFNLSQNNRIFAIFNIVRRLSIVVAKTKIRRCVQEKNFP
jgi:hypothetical protein